MATITMSIASTPVTGSKSYTISDADVTRWLTALKSILAEPNQSPLTNAQVLVKWADATVEDMRRQTGDYERRVADAARTPIVTS